MYFILSWLKYGWYVFKMLSNKTSEVACKVMIGGCCEKGLWDSTLKLYSLRKNEDVKSMSTLYSAALIACGNGEQVHSQDAYKLGQLFDFFQALSF